MILKQLGLTRPFKIGKILSKKFLKGTKMSSLKKTVAKFMGSSIGILTERTYSLDETVACIMVEPETMLTRTPGETDEQLRDRAQEYVYRQSLSDEERQVYDILSA